VTDTGPGIAADKLEEIFEPFVQVNTRLTRVHEGVGLGLAISRDLARGMGGELSVRSTLGRGSTFTLSVPRGGSRDGRTSLSTPELRRPRLEGQPQGEQ
jgi:signal transduction histidine kinase